MQIQIFQETSEYPSSINRLRFEIGLLQSNNTQGVNLLYVRDSIHGFFSYLRKEESLVLIITRMFLDVSSVDILFSLRVL